ncbi:polyhydroxyalkanoic acid system family protein [Chondromyces crocatus]|uniref:Polyhydroxyalkanoic acid synthase n=1 Tax=Chondromyces crocatus TaxID=52 RepID=A0A0K1EB15_CHOCO|nr:polyhydroxyalkanoic acid system family protein [Chondromyces crocatus]AKT38056.1 polyhydroxyalkanoic acid synthase [Chondromyces crocatus]
MATIDIRRQHTLSKDDAKARAEQLIRGMEEKLGIRWKWAGENIEFEAPEGAAKGAKGKVTLSASEIRVEIDLPFLLRPMKGMVESKVNERLDKLIVKS